MLCVKKHSHAQWRDFKMNVLVCDDDRKIVDLLTYSLSFAVGMLATSVCGMDAQTFQADKTLSLIYGISYYSAELFIIALFRKMMLQRIADQSSGIFSEQRVSIM